jgi:hypothetical protein
MASLYIAQASNPYLDHTFWKWRTTQINLNTIYHIIGIILPLIKTTCATSIKYKTKGMLSLHFEQAFHPCIFYKIWSSIACPFKSNTEKK